MPTRGNDTIYGVGQALEVYRRGQRLLQAERDVTHDASLGLVPKKPLEARTALFSTTLVMSKRVCRRLYK